MGGEDFVYIVPRAKLDLLPGSLSRLLVEPRLPQGTIKDLGVAWD